MKLYIKQKVFSWADRFTVKNRNGEDRFFVEGEVISFGKKLHVYDRENREVAYIAQHLFTWMPRYSIYIGGREVAQMVRRFTFFNPRYYLEGPGWEASGDFFAHEYSISQSGRPVASLHKEWMTWGDTYELDVVNDADELLALAAVLVIDAVVEQQNS